MKEKEAENEQEMGLFQIRNQRKLRDLEIANAEETKLLEIAFASLVKIRELKATEDIRRAEQQNQIQDLELETALKIQKIRKEQEGEMASHQILEETDIHGVNLKRLLSLREPPDSGEGITTESKPTPK
ncbi:MAG: hypothetical protein HQL59_08760 [Magnetococcales bacterium]|nr:hypothetical protein [Magnetococcales bacterium]